MTNPLPIPASAIEAAARADWETAHPCEWPGREDERGWERIPWEQLRDDQKAKFLANGEKEVRAAAASILSRIRGSSS